MKTISKDTIKKEIEAIIEENNHMDDWIKNCVGDRKSRVLTAFVNNFCRAMKFNFEYDSELECFDLIDDGLLDAYYCTLHCDLMQFMYKLQESIALGKLEITNG